MYAHMCDIAVIDKSVFIATTSKYELKVCCLPILRTEEDSLVQAKYN